MEPTDTFPIAVLSDALDDLTVAEVARWCEERDVRNVELGVGGYSAAPHLRASGDDANAVVETLAAEGVGIVALNASGNPLHPDPAIAAAHSTDLRRAIELAGRLGVSRVVAMSGCPGGPGDAAWPVFAGGAWLPDMERLWEHQWPQVIAPYWTELSEWAERIAPGVAICLELHPGTSIYNAASFMTLSEVVGSNVRVNLDPSHFWWQGIDPVASIAALAGCIGFVHGKDTTLHPERIALHGVLDYRWPSDADTMPWHFSAVGSGRPVAEWAALLEALQQAGYTGPVSIEHEDPALSGSDGLDASLSGLRAALELLAVEA